MDWKIPEEFTKKSNKKREISRDFRDELSDQISSDASDITRFLLHFLGTSSSVTSSRGTCLI